MGGGWVGGGGLYISLHKFYKPASDFPPPPLPTRRACPDSKTGTPFINKDKFISDFLFVTHDIFQGCFMAAVVLFQ